MSSPWRAYENPFWYKIQIGSSIAFRSIVPLPKCLTYVPNQKETGWTKTKLESPNTYNIEPQNIEPYNIEFKQTANSSLYSKHGGKANLKLENEALMDVVMTFLNLVDTEPVNTINDWKIQ